MREHADIAVVGLACRFPGADDAAQYWQNVLHDTYSIAPMPPDRFTASRYYDPEIGAYGKSYCQLGGLVSEPEFDARAFRMPPKSVAATDVSHLIALQVARDALTDAGYDPFALQGSNVGVLVGHARGSAKTADMAFATASEALCLALEDAPTLAGLGLERLGEIRRDIVGRIRARYPKLTEDGAAGYMTSGLAGLVANAFGLTGRHMVVDAACASSFAALEIGIRALRQGHLDAALVGGASYSQELSVIMFAQSRALSPNGSFPFDARADGFISSDGFGLFLLKRLEDAVRSGDRIRAVIRGIGGACDGKGKALWAPRQEGQVLAMRRAHADAGVDPGTVDLIEAHATSTPLGDRTEILSLHEVFAEARGGRPVAVGSVKGNIGHAREAAGAAGLAKAILAIEQATLPPTGNLRSPSTEIPWSDVAVEVVREARPWAASGPRRAGCNAFGIGGLDYHVVVEEAPARRPSTRPARAARIEANGAPPAACEIAIVGLGARYPASNSAEALFDNLLAKADLSCRVPPERWPAEVYHQPGDRAPYRTYLDRGAFVRDFVPDWRRYRMPPKLVERNDPLQFMLLESALDALEGAGIDPSTIDRQRVAVIMGNVFGSDFALDLALAIRAQELAEEVAAEIGDPSVFDEVLAAVRARLPSINEDSSGSFSSSTLASRIAKTLDLMGPAYTVDAACASSLASVEAACELLRAGQVDLALAGGGDRAMRVQRFEAYCQFYALTKDTPRPFDARADGFMPGEGAGVLALERLEDAERSGHPIFAVIRGIGSSSDGEKKSMYRPSAAGLARAMRRAFAPSGLAPAEVGFVECHGGATEMGDRIEVAAVRDVYGEGPVVLGSIKSNIGHTQGAAGVAGLVKAALTLHRSELPPTRGFETPHPDHDLGGALRVTQTPEPYAASATAVSSMGLAGINYHALLARPGAARPETTMTAHDTRPARLAAPTLDQLAARAAEVSAQELWSARVVGEGPAVVTFAALDADDLQRGLDVLRRTGADPRTAELREKQGVFVRSAPSRPDRIAFLFSGQGSQHPGMMDALCAAIPACAQMAERIDAWCAQQALPPISARMRSGAPLPTSVFGVQSMVLAADLVALAALESAGVSPDVITGHSFGDYAALVAAGAWTVETALFAARLRCNAIEGAEVSGAMASAAAAADAVQPHLQGDAVVANRNAPDQTVIAGSTESVADTEAALARAGLEVQRLDVPGPFHSPRMAAAQDLLTAGFAGLELRAPTVPYLSSVTGRFETEPEAIRASLVRQLVEPVDFVAQVQRLVEEGVTVFVEAGPRAVLAGLTRRIVADADVTVVTVDDKARPGPWALARLQAALEARRTAGAGAVATPTARPAAGSHLSVLEGPEAEDLMSEPGFSDFWTRTRPGVVALVERLWAEEKRHSQAPVAEPAPIAEPRQVTLPPEVAPPPEPSEAPTPSEAPPAPSAGPRPSRDELQAFLLNAICEESGYPPDIIELDADLEADLGIDTVKQAQVFGRVRDTYGLRADERLALRDFPTLRKVLDYVDGQLSEQAAAPAVASRVAVVDLTSRRPAKPDGAAGAPVNGHGPANGGAQARPRSPSAPRPAPRAVEDEAEPAPTEPSADPAGGGPTPRFAPLSRGADGLFALPAPQVRLPQGAPIPVTVLDLEGSAREIGRQHGARMRDPIRQVLARYQAFVGEAGLALLELPETTHRLRRQFDDDTLEEIEGMAEAVEVHPLFLLAYNLDAALFPALTSGCTQALHLARVNAGRMIHLVNEDSPLLLHLEGLCPRVVQRRRRTDGPRPDRRTTFFSMAGQVCGPNGFTDDGLTVTGTTLLDVPPPSGLPDGLPHPQLVKRLLERAEGLDAAVALVREADRTGRWSVLVSEASTDRGHYLEYDGDALLTDRAVSDRVSNTNHALAGPSEEVPAPEHSVHRHARACALLDAARPLTSEAAQDLLRDRHDLGRARDVRHATMNTVRRVDNVMSLVVEPTAAVAYVSDRVVPPGPRGAEEVQFLRLGGVDLTAHLPAGDDVMRRHVVRLRAVAPPAAAAGAEGGAADRDASPAVLLVGAGPRADAIAEAMAGRGRRVRRVEAVDEALRTLDASPAGTTLGVVLDAPPAPAVTELHPTAPRDADAAWALTEQAWASRRRAALEAPFALLRAWQARGPAFVVTRLGGDLGFGNGREAIGEQGGWLGALKAWRRELGQRGLVLDAAPAEPPAKVAAALLAELDAAEGRLEVGLLRGQRLVLGLPERAAPPREPWSLPESWVVTGGGRGITARIARHLAAAYRPRLHVFGRRPLPSDELAALDADALERRKQDWLQKMRGEPGFTPKAWQARCANLDQDKELVDNLAALRATGSAVTYHAVDLADRAAVSNALDDARAHGPLQGILHGAGVEVAKPLDKKTDALFEATVGGKVDGLVHLLHHTLEDPIRAVIGFSSVSGRFGGHGQVDYALANEALAGILRQHRAHHPERRVSTLSWAAFSEVGLAARGSAKTFLERTGQAFMTPDEGARHVLRELAAGLPEPEVVICERLEALDLDHTMVPEPRRAAWHELRREVEAAPMLGALVHHDDVELRTERRLAPQAAFLADHRMGAVPILPAVLALEAFWEAAQAVLHPEPLAGDPFQARPALEDVRILTPLKVPSPLTAQVVRQGDRLRLVTTPRRPDGLVLDPERGHVEATLARDHAGVPPSPPPAYEADGALTYPYPDAPDATPGSRAIYHGPTFRTLVGVAPGPAGGVARLRVPRLDAAFDGRPGARLPVAVLDGVLQAIGLLARARLGVLALPAGFGRVLAFEAHAAEPGTEVSAVIRDLQATEAGISASFVLYGRGDTVWVDVTDYTASTVPGAPAVAVGAPA